MANFPRKAFILGAGLGTRLKPLTDNTPKPLLPIAGEPMVKRALRHLIRAGVGEFIINTHHCPEAWATAFPTNEFETAKITFVHEPTLLETGGGLANIAPLLNESDMDLVIWNGDILSECDLLALFNTHVKTGAESTLLVRKEGPNPNVRVDNKGNVTDLRNRLNAKGGEYQYTGICIVTRNFALSVPATAESLVEHFLRRITEKAGSIRAFLDSSILWEDIGTPEAYEALRKKLEPRITVSLEEAARGQNCDLIAGGEIVRGGSARKFARCQSTTHGKGILCVDDGSKPENQLYGPIARTLRQAGLNVPNVLAEDGDRGVLLLEDLGTQDLLATTQAVAFPWSAYASAIEQAVRLHRDGAAAIQTAGITLSEPFSPALYRWEREYFMEHATAGARLDRGVQDEMTSLATELLKDPLVCIHRDFQSQNILMHENSAWMIDFQGARMGSSFYDFASLAFDPYVKRDDMQLWRLEIEDHAREASEWKGTRDAFSQLFNVAATQRLLQACGAYANLGRRQGRPDFLAHLPQGLALLAIAATQCGRYRLANLARELADRAQKNKGK